RVAWAWRCVNETAPCESRVLPGIKYSRSPGRKTWLFVFAFKKNPVPKGTGFFAVWGISPPVALRLPGLQKRSPDKVRSTAFIASQNSVTNACGMVNRIVNLPDDTSRKIIISSYD
ncbi:hypothetical protein, partial [Klebsiella pneumoniae]|uniref:hypothetical protein n=2 Tax=Klebsiella pneumoniae TaxID=573 RepID=UPI0034D3A4EB